MLNININQKNDVTNYKYDNPSVYSNEGFSVCVPSSKIKFSINMSVHSQNIPHAPNNYIVVKRPPFLNKEDNSNYNGDIDDQVLVRFKVHNDGGLERMFERTHDSNGKKIIGKQLQGLCVELPLDKNMNTLNDISNNNKVRAPLKGVIGGTGTPINLHYRHLN
ncbi:MAG: hypothetical protein HRU03_01810 [Nanoarchaeales archaeon]|nr:hypothetical protein [Nanoarchaeales archaeon]